MKTLMKGVATLAVTAAILAAFAGAAIYASRGGGGQAAKQPASHSATGESAPSAPSDQAAQGPAGDQSAPSGTVAGWSIAEADDTFQDDPRYRVVRLEHRVGRQRIEYTAIFSPWSPERWEASLSATAASADGSCSVGGGAVSPPVWPAAAERVRVIRALLASRLAGIERDCRVPADTTAPLLEGFEAAFADLAARHARWQVQTEAAGPPEAHIG